MGAKPSVMEARLPQEERYVKHCRDTPKPFNKTLEIQIGQSAQECIGEWIETSMSGGEGGRSQQQGVEVRSTLYHLDRERTGKLVAKHEQRPGRAVVESVVVESKGIHASASVGMGREKEELNNDNNNEEVVRLSSSTGGGGGDNSKVVEDSLMMAAGAVCNQYLDHILDGYSWGVVVRIATTQDKKTAITVAVAPVESDVQLRTKEERRRKELQFGMFSKGYINPLKYLFCCGRLCELATTGLVIERSTAHQPIFFPPLNHAVFCSANTYPAFEVKWEEAKPDQMSLKEISHEKVKRKSVNYVPSKFRRWNYVCMHPQYDANGQQLLTYTFKHATTVRKTTIWLYGFDTANPATAENYPRPIRYVMWDRVALHMFGFTTRYYVVFANSLQLEPNGNCHLICGKPILRTINDDFCGDLIIHFIPRPGQPKEMKPFFVNTKRQGNVYHTINCFDMEDGSVVVDAFVSQLNSARESAQFELNEDRWVFDNSGEPYRFHVMPPPESGVKCCGGSDKVPKTFNACQNLSMASRVDSTIDFHCVNPRYNGVKYRYSYLVSHRRHRSPEHGRVEYVESILHKLDINLKDEKDPLSYQPDYTEAYSFSSNSWLPKRHMTSYLRTPLFVQHYGSTAEDDGKLFCWSFDETPDGDKHALHAHILMFAASNLDLLVRVPMPDDCIVPYTVHSAIYSRSFAQPAKQWENTTIRVSKDEVSPRNIPAKDKKESKETKTE